MNYMKRLITHLKLVQAYLLHYISRVCNKNKRTINYARIYSAPKNVSVENSSFMSDGLRKNYPSKI